MLSERPGEGEKLVRSGIPDKDHIEGKTFIYRKVEQGGLPAALKAKLLEEANEVKNAETPDNLKEELGDVLTVIKDLAAASGIPWGDLLTAAEKKDKELGNFSEGFVSIKP